MMSDAFKKYRPFIPISLTDRKWPDCKILKAPRWLSTDLRDGNQALVEPMSVETKLIFFELLINMGFKEIEVGFPSASRIEFDFVQRLICEHRIPDDVTIQVLTPAQPELINQTMASLKGAA